MNKTLHYLFDPLCGWCYGIMPAISPLAQGTDVTLNLLPTGLFSDQASRPMDDDFAAFAWSNDQRIAHLTGQRFTETYRQSVLGDRERRFDSGPATRALTAVALTKPQREHEALKHIQLARFADGQDVTSLSVLADVLVRLGLNDAAALMMHSAAYAQEASLTRVGQAQALLHQFGARGVPTLILESESGHSLLDTSAVFSNPGALAEQLRAA
ncbi:DsbA family protein [Saccharospirillum alexandrii]|uniref:DsbA family protein n=1 Tax=Saccharospirillum alexandrii TaxID=2448477 RepID=UPI000FD94513|nr:DsbA family protein [Saccharospirillum alexandrii]